MARKKKEKVDPQVLMKAERDFLFHESRLFETKMWLSRYKKMYLDFKLGTLISSSRLSEEEIQKGIDKSEFLLEKRIECYGKSKAFYETLLSGS